MLLKLRQNKQNNFWLSLISFPNKTLLKGKTATTTRVAIFSIPNPQFLYFLEVLELEKF
jgi:hypothetical protein